MDYKWEEIEWEKRKVAEMFGKVLEKTRYGYMILMEVPMYISNRHVKVGKHHYLVSVFPRLGKVAEVIVTYSEYCELFDKII